MHISRWLSEQTNPLLRTIDGRVRRWRVNSRILVSETGCFVFFRVPKAGHSTVCRTLVHYDPNLDEELRQVYLEQSRRNVPYLHPRDIGLRASRRALRDYYLFTFVRNPYRRVLSAYLDKVTRSKKAAKNLSGGLDESHTLSFHDFLSQLHGPTLFQGPHWCPQVALLPRNRDRLNLIGRLETINDDMEQLIHALFGRSLEAGIQNWDVHRTRSGSDFGRYYDATAIDTVRSLYQEDFAAFGYSTDPDAAL